MVESGKLIVRQVRGTSGRSKHVINTLKALGLGHLGDSIEHKINRSVLGAIAKVKHLVTVREA